MLEGSTITIPLTGAGSLGVRLGHQFGRIADDLSLQGGTATTNVTSGASYPAGFSAIEADFAAGTALKQIPDGIYTTLAAMQTAQGPTLTALGTLAQNTLKAMVSVDAYGMTTATPFAQLTAISLPAALQYLISQMNANSTTFNASTLALGAQTAVGTPAGNPVIYGSTKTGQGLVQQYAYTETLTFACTSDSQTGGATAGNEPVSVTGQPQAASTMSPLWPAGSGVTASLSAVDGSKNYPATGNLLQNSDFATVNTTNNPDNWTIVTGTAGTDIFSSPGNAYTTGGGALAFTGTAGAVLDCVTQSFNTAPTAIPSAGGTSYALLPDTVYLGNGWVKGSTTFAAGALAISLVDGTAGIGTIINDDQAVANSVTFTLTSGGIALGTSWQNINFAFRTPAILPATTPYRLRLRASTAITNGTTLYMGRFALTAVASPLYPGGPYYAVFSGNTRMIAGRAPDTWTAAVTSTLGVFQSYFQRTCNMNALGLIIPNTTSGPTVADSLVA